MIETDEMDSILATRRPYLFMPENDSVQSSRHSVLSQDTEQQIRMYSRMLRQINKEVSKKFKILMITY